MSAGFDKNAEIINSLFNFGFGFVEAGTTTPIAQAGNEQPRIFRLIEDNAIINRLGFNNLGANYFYENLSKINKDSAKIIGVNIGKNKDTVDASSDYILLLEKFYNHADYITINISSPNTKNLRDLQNENLLNDFLQKISQCKNNLQKVSNKNTPILLKIAPDLEFEQQKNIAKIVIDNNIDGVIISNTTIARDLNLKSLKSTEIGGLSGKPLFEKSNEILRNFYRLTEGKIPLIGVGGISSAQDAYAKIKNGASLIQIYSAFIYQGFSLVEKIKKQLSENLKKDGFKNISESIGSSVK
jgi:dihydroorotate dehydrogenase